MKYESIKRLQQKIHKFTWIEKKKITFIRLTKKVFYYGEVI